MADDAVEDSSILLVIMDLVLGLLHSTSTLIQVITPWGSNSPLSSGVSSSEPLCSCGGFSSRTLILLRLHKPTLECGSGDFLRLLGWRLVCTFPRPALLRVIE